MGQAATEIVPKRQHHEKWDFAETGFLQVCYTPPPGKEGRRPSHPEYSSTAGVQSFKRDPDAPEIGPGLSAQASIIKNVDATAWLLHVLFPSHNDVRKSKSKQLGGRSSGDCLVELPEGVACGGFES